MERIYYSSKSFSREEKKKRRRREEKERERKPKRQRTIESCSRSTKQTQVQGLLYPVLYDEF